MALKYVKQTPGSRETGPKKNIFARASDVDAIITAVNNLIDGSIGTTDLTVAGDLTVGDDATVTGDLAVTGATSSTGLLTASSGISQGTANVIEYTVLTTLTATEIVGTSAGDIGHASGAILVAAPSSDYALEFVSAVLVFDYATAAYTGGANDMVINVGTVAATSALTDTNCIKATGDKVFRLGAISTEKSLPVGSTINITSTAFTQPGTAAGVLRVYTTYRKIATGL